MRRRSVRASSRARAARARARAASCGGDSPLFQRRRVPRRLRYGQIPLWLAVSLGVILVVVLGVWTFRETRGVAPDGRQQIVFWAKPSTDPNLDDDTEILVHRF